MEDRLFATELYESVRSLQDAVERAGERRAAQELRHLSGFASGSSSEFFGEARILLPRLLREYETTLSDIQKARLREIIVGIEREFSLSGGA